MSPGCSSPVWNLAAVIVLCLVSTTAHQKVVKRASGFANFAPRITRHPIPEMAFRVGEDVTLPCTAAADMDITYFWKKDGQPVNLTVGGKIEGRASQGSIIIRLPNSTDEGVYQCFAKTNYGTALSTKTILKAAVLESFPTVLSPLQHRPLVGQPLNLSCNPPKNYPTGRIYWGVSAVGSSSSKLEGIDNDDRILLDYNGRLYFANVIPEDSFERIDRNLFYVCIVHNKLLGKFVKGNEQKVAPVDVAAEHMRHHAPQAMWTSPQQDKAIRGQNKRLKCIFSGLPTPKVTWSRLGGEMSSRVNVTPEGHGTEIEIQKVDYADAGIYECTATNSEGTATRTLRLTVDSAPYWRQNKIPTDVEVIEDDPAEIDCLADGSPRPTIEWYINGVPIHEAEPDERRKVTGNRLSYDQVTISRDRHVIQCSATNEHGQILANMILNIQAFAPSFLNTPMDTKVVQGHNVTLQCRAAGAPRPDITWTRASTNRTIQDHRFSQLSDGNLEIKNADLEDSGEYVCRIRNKFGNDSVAAKLLVRRPTLITKSPQDQTVNVTDDVTLQCDVTTDAAEMEQLEVFWKKNEDRIDFIRDDRLQLDPDDHSLIIRSAEIDDTAVYTCHADNGLDTASSGAAILTVKGPPQPPTDVQVRRCSMHVASVTWRPARDNNDPVNEYIVYYNRSHDPSGNVTEAARVAAPVGGSPPPMELSADIRLHPWATYTFFVVAVNSMGPGLPSQVSDVCITPETIPSHNPSGVCSKLVGPKQLTIVWEALPREQMNGEGFHYKVGYRLLDGEGHQQEIKVLRDPGQTELVIHDQESFRRYEIYVQSANNMGATPLSSSSKRIGYSGEGKPTVIPQDVRFNKESLTSTYVELSWNSVDTSEDKMNGFFRGYRIQFWRTDRPDEKRTEDIVLRPHFDRCPSLSGEPGPNKRRRRRQDAASSSAVVSGSTNRLWPFSRIQAGVMALNQVNQGNLSHIVEFQTPEGVPGAPLNFGVTQAGSNHLLVEWTKPLDVNGILTHYLLTYHIADPHLGSIKHRVISPSKQSYKMLDLSPSTSYTVSLSTATKAGHSETLYITGRTLPQAAPSKPEIGGVDVGDTSANVSWVPSGKEAPGNPGSIFYVQYRDNDDPQGRWNRTEPITDENWANVTGLVPGRTYEIQVVSVNGLEDNEEETKSDIITVYVPTEGERTTITTRVEELILRRGDVAAWWFIVLMCIIILLLIVLFIICAIYRSRGQMYPVFEKERLWGSPHKTDEQPFGEYARENPPLRSTELRKSRESLESDQKPLDSDSTDSLGDYDDADPSKFNEDGSFIGVYNAKTRQAPSSVRASKRRAAAENGRAANTYV